MRIISVTIALIVFTSVCYAQVQELQFCDKRWYCEMTKDKDGTIHAPEKGTEKDYMHFTCDSAFTLAEAGLLLKDKWTFDNETMIITLIQEQIATMPEYIAFHILDYDERHLVLVGQKGTNSEQVLYLYVK